MIRLVILLGAVALAGCTPPAPSPGTDPSGMDRLSYLALGDSYTIGEGVPQADRWPHQLAARLRAEGVPLADPTTVAVTGWTTDELDAGIQAASLQGTYDFVTLLIGVNDQYRGRSLQRYRAGFRDLLEQSIAFAGGRPDRVVVVSIPDWGGTPFAQREGRDPAQVARELDGYNEAAAEIAEALGVAFVDVTELSRTQGAQVVADGLHPSAAAYSAWTDLIDPEARRALAPDP